MRSRRARLVSSYADFWISFAFSCASSCFDFSEALAASLSVLFERIAQDDEIARADEHFLFEPLHLGAHLARVRWRSSPLCALMMV